MRTPLSHSSSSCHLSNILCRFESWWYVLLLSEAWNMFMIPTDLTRAQGIGQCWDRRRQRWTYNDTKGKWNQIITSSVWPPNGIGVTWLGVITTAPWLFSKEHTKEILTVKEYHRPRLSQSMRTTDPVYHSLWEPQTWSITVYENQTWAITVHENHRPELSQSMRTTDTGYRENYRSGHFQDSLMSLQWFHLVLNKNS